MSAPNPMLVAAIANKRKQAEAIPAAPAAPAMPVVAQHDPNALAGLPVTLGEVDEVVTTIHDGVVKAKNLRPAARVRPYVRGVARGSERIVKSVTKIGNGAEVEVEFHSAHPTQTFKAAYRFFDESLVGVEVGHIVKKRAFVAAHQSDFALKG